MRGMRGRRARVSATPAQASHGEGLARSVPYRWFLAWMAFPPLLLLLLERPVAVIVAYAVTGSFFMPFLASVLLVMNNRRPWIGAMRNGPLTNLLLVLSLVLFGAIFVVDVLERI
jgi:Mn2+/Fe2+ NRAMP family transporter